MNEFPSKTRRPGVKRGGEPLEPVAAVLRPRPGHHRGSAFTLVELLAVLAVIGILASLVVGLTSRASTAAKEARTRAMLSQLEVAIEDYHSTMGFYPPDNPGRVIDPATGLPLSEPALNPLFYELSGAIAQADHFLVPSVNERIAATEVRGFFNLDGFANVALGGAAPKSFIKLRAEQYQQVSGPQVGPGLPEVTVLVAPVKWPANLWEVAPTKDPLERVENPLRPTGDQVRRIAHINPWRYVSSHPVNNPGRYDLWAEYMAGKKLKVVSNWRGDIQER